MKSNFSKERKEFIRNLNKGKKLSDKTIQLMRERVLNRSDEIKDKYRKASFKPLILYNLDGTINSSYSGIREMAKFFKCCHKTINKTIKNNKMFREFGYIKYDN